MKTNIHKKSLEISEQLITQLGGVVIIPLAAYQQLFRRNFPTYYLQNKAASSLDQLVEKGLKDYKEGRCRKIKSLADLD